MKPIGPLCKSFGSKWSATKRGNYPAPIEGLPIFEPFAGGAGYSLNFHWFPVTLWETNYWYARLWSWLIKEATSQDIMGIPVGWPTGYDILKTDLSEGQKLLLKSWQRTNNHGNCWTISKWANCPGQWTYNTRSRIAEEIHAIKHWKFEYHFWSGTGTWFVDPPYQFNYRYGVKDFDFEQLAANVNSLTSDSLVICCEAACQKTGAVPDYLPFQTSHQQVTSRRKKSNNHHSSELVYIRRPNAY